MSTARVARALDPPADWPLWAGLLAAETVAVATYLLTVGHVAEPRYLVYPFLWINVGLYAVARADSPPGDAAFSTALARFLSVGRDLSDRDRRRMLAAGVAGGYLLLLAVVTGLVGLPHLGHAHSHGYVPDGWLVSLSVPGWGPRVAYVAGSAHVYFVPYRVIGYVALAYLLYARLASASLASSAGLLGLASCISCSFPLVASLVSGAGVGAAAALGGFSLDVSTAAYLSAVVLLWWPWGDG
ncbi:DUF7546 family protein [Halorarius halobius]|uniref:DUF7546 family protein n=1 Tax=Halorarius halobius TaxID=2962671 RepID=UPI0020CCE9EA|nr:hypothetical protein [Halorarius halobius]